MTREAVREAEGAGFDEEVDPELVAMPSPPRGERTFTLVLLAVTAAASVAMAAALRHDVGYALGGETPRDLGELRTAAPAALGENVLVRGEALLAATAAIRYEHPFERDTYRLAPVAGRPDLWVELRVPAGEESARYVPPTSFTGRLVRFDGAGPRHRGLADAVAALTPERVPAGAWLLVDGAYPEGARWAVALVGLFLAFAAWNGVVFARLVRRVR